MVFVLEVYCLLSYVDLRPHTARVRVVSRLKTKVPGTSTSDKQNSDVCSLIWKVDSANSEGQENQSRRQAKRSEKWPLASRSLPLQGLAVELRAV